MGIFLFGFALRLIGLADVPLRGDEAFSAQYWAGLPLSESLQTIATIEPHPPLTYGIFSLWGTVLGIDSAFALRLLSVLGNMFGVAGMYAIGKRFGDRWLGVILAFIWAIHPFQIWHAQDFRNYGLWAGLSTWVIAIGLLIIQQKKSNITTWLLYGFFGTISLLIFYFEGFIFVVLGLYGLIQRQNWQFRLRWMAINAVIVAIVGVAFLVLQGELIGSGSYTGTTGKFVFSELWTWFLPTLWIGDNLAVSDVLWLTIIILTGLGLFLLWRQNIRVALFVTLCLFIPIILLSVISTQMSVFRPRYIMNAIPSLMILLGFLLRYSVKWQRSFVIVLCVLYFAFVGSSLNMYYTTSVFAKSPDWELLNQTLTHEITERDVVIQTSIDAAFGYYYQADADELALPESPIQSTDDIESRMSVLASDYEQLWVVGRTYSDWQNAGDLESWAENNLQVLRQFDVAGIPVKVYQSYEVAEVYTALETPMIFDELFTLYGYTISTDLNGDLIVMLYWQKEAESNVALSQFVHLVGNINPATGSPLWSQDDHPIPNHATTALYRDIAILDVDTLSGEFQLHIGLYGDDGVRLLTQEGNDAVIIEGVQLN